MLSCQRHLFQLPDDISYLNGAYMSPLLKSVEDAGLTGIRRKRNPSSIKPEDFFSEAAAVCIQLGQLVNGSSGQIALIPSASYGLKTAVNNLPTNNGKYALTVSDEFPSGYYTISNWCKKNNKELKIISPADTREQRGMKWNEKILASIDQETAVVILSSVHWTDGTLFDLQKIGERCKAMNALFIVDGTQSVGALPIDVTACRIDALVCAGYKWLLGPYSTGFAYYSDFFNAGTPLEDTWMNKSNAQNFSSLVSYSNEYAPGAARYHMGEFSNFALLPMLHAAVAQILHWQVPLIQAYSEKLVTPLADALQERNWWIEDKAFRSAHLFGFLLPPSVAPGSLVAKLQERKIFVSLRGVAIRVSGHVYNTEEDIAALIEVLKEV
jgi:selenocysteine lyase/cysteine desulfurase